MNQKALYKLKTLMGPVPVFLAVLAISLIAYFSGVRPACWPVAIALAIGSPVGIYLSRRWKQGWYGGISKKSIRRSASWRKWSYVCTALLAAETLLSLSVADVGTYWMNSISSTGFYTIRVLKTPSGPVERVHYRALGFALKPCPRCLDEAAVNDWDWWGDEPQPGWEFRGRITTCIRGHVRPKNNPATMTGVFMKELDPRRALEKQAWDRMRECARPFKELPEGISGVDIASCPTDVLPFVIDHLSIYVCQIPRAQD